MLMKITVDSARSHSAQDASNVFKFKFGAMYLHK